MESKHTILVYFLLGLTAISCDTIPCALRMTEHGSVCICNATYCDYLDNPTPKNENEFVIVSSTKAGLRFKVTEGSFNLIDKHHVMDYDKMLPLELSKEVNKADDDSEKDVKNEAAEETVMPTRYVRLNINRGKRHQTIVGFGGSFTGAVSHILNSMSQELQDHIYKSYYSERGIGFNLLRMSIGGCDFDLAPWAYNELPENDSELTNFVIDPRDEIKFIQMKRMINVAEVKNLRIKGAAWSSPPWMKSNNDWTGFSHLKKEYYQTWANYHLKWLELLEANGLPVWAISTGNEPMNGVLFMPFVKFMSLGWTPKNQAIWLADYLGPTIRNSKFKDLIIFSNDDQRYTFPKWFNMMNATRPKVLDYVNGMAVHWYWDEMVDPKLIDKTREQMPDRILLTTESCIGDKPWHKDMPLLGSWERSEKYARAFLQNLQHGFNGWIDWNIILDEQGGPNYVDNTVDAPVIANMTNPTEIYKQPMFYAIGHFSKFIPEGSIRIDTVRSNINIETVAFLRPDGYIATVLLNSARAAVEVSVIDNERGTFIINLPARSIHTLIYK